MPHVLKKGISILLTIAVVGAFLFCLFTVGTMHATQGMDHSPVTHLTHMNALTSALTVQAGVAAALLAAFSVVFLSFFSATPADGVVRLVRYGRVEKTSLLLLLRRWLSRLVRSPGFMALA